LRRVDDEKKREKKKSCTQGQGQKKGRGKLVEIVPSPSTRKGGTASWTWRRKEGRKKGNEKGVPSPASRKKRKIGKPVWDPSNTTSNSLFRARGKHTPIRKKGGDGPRS